MKNKTKRSSVLSSIRKSIEDLSSVQDVRATLKKFDKLQGKSNTTTNANKNTGEDEWITPLHILKPLGKFDLDPCTSVKQPWRTAKKMLTIKDNGLTASWKGRVWLNPPYGRVVEAWMYRMASHKGGGIALIASRVDTNWFHGYVFGKADSILFLRGRITFCDTHGKPATIYNKKLKKRVKTAAGFPSALVAYSRQDTLWLKKAQKTLRGFLVFLVEL